MINPALSNTNFIARFSASSETNNTSSTRPFMSLSASGTGVRTAMPSAIVLADGRSITVPERHDASMASAVALETPMICTSGATCLIYRETPPINAPLPSGTRTASNVRCCINSTAIDPAPSEIAMSRPSSTKYAPISVQNFLAFSLAASKLSPIGRTSAPIDRIRSTLRGLAFVAQ